VTGYNPLLARLAPLGKTALLTLYVQAYPQLPVEMAEQLSRDALLTGLLNHADSRPRRATRPYPREALNDR
jgi:hypothetical protein